MHKTTVFTLSAFILMMLCMRDVFAVDIESETVPVTSPTPTETLFKPGKFHYDGHIFLNATRAGVQGENYLLNEQLSNVKLRSDWDIAPWLKWHGLLIYNTNPTPITPELYFEQAYFKLTSPHGSDGFMNVGRKWLTFGSYKNDLIYKPLTKALGQTNEYTVEAGFDDGWYANMSLYDPHTRIRSSRLPLYYNLNAGLHRSFYDVGVSYLYSIAESQLFQYNKGFGGFLRQSIDNHVPGAAAYANFKYQSFTTYLTYVSAVHAFRANEVSYQGSGAIPAALSVQSGYEFKVKNTPLKVIGFADYSMQALALKLPEKRVGMGLNMYPCQYLDVQFQYFKDYSYAANKTAAGLNQGVNKIVSGNANINNTFALQLVVNF